MPPSFPFSLNACTSMTPPFPPAHDHSLMTPAVHDEQGRTPRRWASLNSTPSRPSTAPKSSNGSPKSKPRASRSPTLVSPSMAPALAIPPRPRTPPFAGGPAEAAHATRTSRLVLIRCVFCSFAVCWSSGCYCHREVGREIGMCTCGGRHDRRGRWKCLILQHRRLSFPVSDLLLTSHYLHESNVDHVCFPYRTLSPRYPRTTPCETRRSRLAWLCTRPTR